MHPEFASVHPYSAPRNTHTTACGEDSLNEKSSCRIRVFGAAVGAGGGIGLLKHFIGLFGTPVGGAWYAQWFIAILFGALGGALTSICCVSLLASCKCRLLASSAKRGIRATGEVIAIAGACQLFQCVFHNQLCNVLFRCGCTWDWNGGWIKCNVHNMDGPKCPWCVSREYLSWTTDCLPLALMIATFYGSAARDYNLFVSVVLPGVVYAIVCFCVALTYKLVSGYPYFMFGQVHGMRLDHGHTLHHLVSGHR